jgi:hypothetical protein
VWAGFAYKRLTSRDRGSRCSSVFIVLAHFAPPQACMAPRESANQATVRMSLGGGGQMATIQYVLCHLARRLTETVQIPDKVRIRRPAATRPDTHTCPACPTQLMSEKRPQASFSNGLVQRFRRPGIATLVLDDLADSRKWEMHCIQPLPGRR